KLADHFRRLDREERRSHQVLVREIAVGGTDAWRQVDDRDAIRVALRRLPAAQQAVLLFIGLDGLGVPEAARLLGRSRSATQSLLFRARAAFQAAYGHEVSDD
ncbi:MAG TPA: sigma-70 region 4 domain-containing protein, partial [Candidatus Limnocylindrales bacterium]